MKFLIEIEGNTQPQLIESLDEARKTLVDGGCYLNVGGCRNVKMKPADQLSEDHFRSLYAAAHPRAVAAWSK